MSDLEVPVTVGDGELLARFVLFSKWFRPSDNKPKPDAFIPRPPPNLDLSVTRHIGLTAAGLWAIGDTIAQSRENATLYGRADIAAGAVRAQSLRVESTPTPKNHANVIGWPADKPAQKIIALELAAAAVFIPRQ